MNFSRKKTRKYASFLLLPAMILVLCFTLITPLYYQNVKELSGKNMPYHTSEKNPLVYKELTLIITVFTENEILTNAANHHIINRGVQDGRQLITVISCILAILVSGYVILLQYMRCYRRKTSNHVPLLALSIGGHAPPFIKKI